MSRPRSDLAGWLAIFVWVVSWDLRVPVKDEDGNWVRRSLSRVCWDALDGPISGPFTVGAIAGTAFHLVHKPRGH